MLLIETVVVKRELIEVIKVLSEWDSEIFSLNVFISLIDVLIIMFMLKTIPSWFPTYGEQHFSIGRKVYLLVTLLILT